MNIKAILTAALISVALNAAANQNEISAKPDFSVAEPGEAYPGGKTSHRKRHNRRAFSYPSANIGFDHKMDFKLGEAFFDRIWVTAPTVTQAADGLGPLYNARSCKQCHKGNGRGHPPAAEGETAVSLVLRLSVPASDGATAEPTYGKQLQNFSISGIRSEGQIAIDYREKAVKLVDGETVMLRKPTYSIKNLGYGPLHPHAMISPRVAPPMIGLGLLEAIEEKDILSYADPDDNNQDGISGKANRVWSKEFNKEMLGRFNWKAGTATVNEQSQNAFSGDIGISVPLHPKGFGDCTESQTACRKAPDGNSPQYENLEVPSKLSDLVTFYSRNVAVPARKNVNAPEVLAGKKLFYDIGCTSCHRPKYITGSEHIQSELASQQIWPYTDLLLHDMGDGLADHRPEGQANGREWRTAPLWGIGLTQVVNSRAGYLHDGRARTLLEAILWHGGEAQQQRDAVADLNKQERDQLIRFLKSL